MSSLALCQICGREFSETTDLIPRILTECGHTLCTDCSQNIAKTCKKGELTCPFDRITTKLKNGVVTDLKKNFSILQLKDEEQFRKNERLRKKPKERNIYGTCDENSNHRASNFCKKCEADLCDNCWDEVHSFVILAHHEKMNIFDKPVMAPQCRHHPNQLAEFVCKNEPCRLLQKRLMCHVCFRDGPIHHSHGYVTLQSEVIEIRTKMNVALELADEKKLSILKNIDDIKNVITTHYSSGPGFQEKYLELLRFRFFLPEKHSEVKMAMENAAKVRIDGLKQKIANQKLVLNWIEKTKKAIKKKTELVNEKLVDFRSQVDKLVKRIEKVTVKHPKSLLPIEMCDSHVPSWNPLRIVLKPPARIEIRESYHNHVSKFIEQNSSIVSTKNGTLRYKNHFIRLTERTEDMKLFSEGLSLILVVDPFNGDRDRQYVALELLENAPAYERIVVGLNPFNFQAISTFLAKLVSIKEKDSRIHIVYINDPKDIESIVDLSLE